MNRNEAQVPRGAGLRTLLYVEDNPANLKLVGQIIARIPVTALSANADPLNVESGLEAGFFRYLTKPIKVNEFMEVLAAALKFAGKNLPTANRMGFEALRVTENVKKVQSATQRRKRGDGPDCRG